MYTSNDFGVTPSSTVPEVVGVERNTKESGVGLEFQSGSVDARAAAPWTICNRSIRINHVTICKRQNVIDIPMPTDAQTASSDPRPAW
jgi:hypothetical protein